MTVRGGTGYFKLKSLGSGVRISIGDLPQVIVFWAENWDRRLVGFGGCGFHFVGIVVLSGCRERQKYSEQTSQNLAHDNNHHRQ